IIALTASTLSNSSANVGSRSTEPSRNSTRPVRIAAALRFVACRTISSEWSRPHTYPSTASRLISLTAIPGLDLIRVGGHLPKGGYDVQTDGRHTQAPASPAVHR